MKFNSTFLPFSITSNQIPQKFSDELFLSELINGYVHHSYTTIYSIKYQISGTEIFRLGSREIKLKENNYLIINNNQNITSFPYETKKAVSIFIDPSTINDVFSNLKRDDDSLLSNPFDYEDDQVLFFENSFSVKDDVIGKTLKSVANSFTKIKRGANFEREDFFYGLSNNLIVSQQETFKEIKSMGCTKYSTRIELFNRMHRAKQILIGNWNKEICLKDLSSQVCMSPYHFHRTFSKIFNVSPLKFHLNVRIEKSIELLKTNKYNVSDVAFLAGYNDIYSFSKAFKKNTGYSPSKYNNLYGN